MECAICGGNFNANCIEECQRRMLMHITHLQAEVAQLRGERGRSSMENPNVHNEDMFEHSQDMFEDCDDEFYLPPYQIPPPTPPTPSSPLEVTTISPTPPPRPQGLPREELVFARASDNTVSHHSQNMFEDSEDESTIPPAASSHSKGSSRDEIELARALTPLADNTSSYHSQVIHFTPSEESTIPPTASSQSRLLSEYIYIKSKMARAFTLRRLLRYIGEMECILGEDKLDRGQFGTAYRHFVASARVGHRRGTFFVGVCYNLGYGVERNETRALYYFTLAARMRYGPAIWQLGVFYESGSGRLQWNRRIARHCFRTATRFDRGD